MTNPIEVLGQTFFEQAQAARESGQRFFTPTLATSFFRSAMSAPLPDWAHCIASIEAAGWRMVHWAVAQSIGGVPVAYPVFEARD